MFTVTFAKLWLLKFSYVYSSSFTSFYVRLSYFQITHVRWTMETAVISVLLPAAGTNAHVLIECHSLTKRHAFVSIIIYGFSKICVSEITPFLSSLRLGFERFELNGNLHHSYSIISSSFKSNEHFTLFPNSRSSWDPSLFAKQSNFNFIDYVLLSLNTVNNSTICLFNRADRRISKSTMTTACINFYCLLQ